MGTTVSITGYIVDMTSEEDRRYRLAILYGARCFGIFLGNIFATIPLQYFRYPTIFCFPLAILAFTVVIIIVRIRSDTIIKDDIALLDTNSKFSSESKGDDTEQWIIGAYVRWRKNGCGRYLGFFLK